MDSANYEKLVRDICEDLVSGDLSTRVAVHRQREFVGLVSGRKIKVDVSFECTLLGTNVLVVLECKRYKRKVGAGDIEEFHTKLADIAAHKGVVVTTVGYQSGAIKAARGRGIALVVLGPDAGAGKPRVVLKIDKLPEKIPSAGFTFQGCFIPGYRECTNGDDSTGFDSPNEFLYLLSLDGPVEEWGYS